MLMTILQQNAVTLPLWVSKPGEKYVFIATGLKWPLNNDKMRVLKTVGSLMQVESIAECICNTFDLH